MQVALIALGANLPWGEDGPCESLEKALSALESEGDRVVGRSRMFATPCFPAGAGPDYCNAAAAIETRRTPEGLLERLQAIERSFGRERKRRWGSRTLDLDLLAYGDAVLPDRPGFLEWVKLDPGMQQTASPSALVLPHPRIQDRAFVLVPLAEVAPNWRHPVCGRTAPEMLSALPPQDIEAVRPVQG